MNRKDFLKASAFGIGGISIINSLTSCEKIGTDGKPLAASAPTAANNSSIALPENVVNLFAARGHRLHHCLWHSLRDYWDNTNIISEESKAAITSLNWNPPRPSQRIVKNGWLPQILNGSGIDFLFMHREMITEFDEAMKKDGKDPDVGWFLIPEPGKFPEFEVSPSWELSEGLEWLQRRFKALKSDEFYWSRIRWWDREFHDYSYLRTLTLGQLGSLIETSVHNDMHMRWASEPFSPDSGKKYPEGRPDKDINEKWDNPKYDYLGETYSSHVNAIFWRLHKWVNNIIDEWYNAHEEIHPGSITKINYNGIPWFESKEWIEVDNPWSSPTPHAHHDVATMEKVFNLIFNPPSNSKILKVDREEQKGKAPLSWF